MFLLCCALFSSTLNPHSTLLSLVVSIDRRISYGKKSPPKYANSEIYQYFLVPIRDRGLSIYQYFKQYQLLHLHSEGAEIQLLNFG